MTESHLPPERVVVDGKYDGAVRWIVHRLGSLGISSRPAMFQEALEEGLDRTKRVVGAALYGARSKPAEVLWVRDGLDWETGETPETVMAHLAAAYWRVFESP